ncbi:MAG: hypothetical protein ACOZF0_05780 [Thermodesulfobacteriota bacterium]
MMPAAKDPISSTEKLLGVIRNTPASVTTGLQAESRQEPWFHLRKKAFPFVKSVTVGVVVGHRDVTLAMVSRVGDRRYQLMDFRKVALKAGIHKSHAQFPVFLKQTLKQFCGAGDNVHIWSTIPSARVEIRFVKIPKVPDGQVANAVYWSYKKMVAFDEKEMIFDFEILGEVQENGGRKIQAMAYSAPRAEVESWKKLFAEIGFPLSGLSIVPFSLQNLFRTNIIDQAGEHVCSLYIGQDWSRIDIFSAGRLVLSRDIKTGMNSFIESIRTGLITDKRAGTAEAEKQTGEPDREPEETEDRRQPEPGAESGGREEARRLFYRLIRPEADGSRPERPDACTEEEIMDMISPVLDRLVRQVERTLGHFTLHFANKTVERFYLGGEISGFARLVELMGDQLSLPIRHLNPFPESLLSGSLSAVPGTIPEKDSFVPAIGTALSNLNLTPNLMYTYRYKAIQARIQRTNRFIFAAFCLLTCICLGVFYLQERLADQKRAELNLLEKQIARFSPIVDEQLLQKMVARVEANQRMVLSNAGRYLGVSLLNELAELTPEHIRLIQVRLELGAGIEKGRNPSRSLIIEGIVTDRFGEKESELAVYLTKLNGSPLFDRPTVMQKSMKRYQDADVLRFTVKLETI